MSAPAVEPVSLGGSGGSGESGGLGLGLGALGLNLLYAGVVLGVLVLLVLLSTWGSGGGGRAGPVSRPSKTFDARVRSLVQESQRWSDTAARTGDSAPLTALVDAVYGAAYLNVARTLASDRDIERACNLRLDEVLETAAATQQAALSAVTRACPKLDHPGLEALNTGWLLE